MPLQFESPLAVRSADEIFIRTIAHPEWTEYYLTASARQVSPEKWFAHVDQFLKQHHATAVSCDAFGSTVFLKSVQQLIATRNDAWPTNFFVGRMEANSPEGGFQLHAISGVTLQPIRYQGRLVGSCLEDAQAKYCFLSDLRPTRIDVSAAQQTEEVFEIAESALIEAGLDFHDVVRTWFYLDDILAWYPDFNRVRTAYFQSRDIFGGLMPASTGVGAANLAGAAVLTKIHALRPKSKAITVSRVDSPLQCDAYQYGSAFSRAVEVADATSRSLYISGTASIEPGGKTVHVGDVAKQLELSLQVIEAILKHRNMGWSDTAYAIAYFRDAALIPLWEKLGSALAPIPIVATQCDVCRDDLLFEIELLASVIHSK